MNQDECFEEMRQQHSLIPPSLAYSAIVRGSGNVLMRSAAASLIIAITNVNFFSCSLISTVPLVNSTTWLHRMESSLERHGDQFLFKASYRVHSSDLNRWTGGQDALFTLESDIREYYNKHRGNTASDSLMSTTRKYRKTVDKLYSTIAGRTNYTTYPMDGRVITVLIGGKIPKKSIFESERAFAVNYNSITDCHPLMGWNCVTGDQFDSSRGILDVQFTDDGLPHGEAFPVYGRLSVHDRTTDPNVVGAITNADRRLLNKQTYYSDESLYTSYIPRSNSLEEVLVPDKDGWALYLHKGTLPTPIHGKELSDWLLDNTLHVSSTIELFRLSDERSIRLQPGVYQLLYHDEEKRLTESLFVYSDNVKRLVESNYRATFPTGKLQAITVATDSPVVEVSHINVKDLTLPSEDESVTTFFQRSKNI